MHNASMLRRFRSEFVMWAAEIKKIDVEILPKWEEKDLFKCVVSLFLIISAHGIPVHR